MPERIDELNFEQLLAYTDEPGSDEFVANVMHNVRQERRKRQLVLFIFGLVGAAFGVLGAFLLSDSITRLFSSLPVTGTMQAALHLRIEGVLLDDLLQNHECLLQSVRLGSIVVDNVDYYVRVGTFRKMVLTIRLQQRLSQCESTLTMLTRHFWVARIIRQGVLAGDHQAIALFSFLINI